MFAPFNDHSHAEAWYWLAMMHIPLGCLGSVRCDMVAAVEDKADPGAASFRHRLAERPDPIELSCASTFDSPTLLRTESSASESAKVAVRFMALNIDPNSGTHAERAREPSTGVRQRNRGVAPAVRIPDERPSFGLDPEPTLQWRKVRQLDQQLAQHRSAELAPASDHRGGVVSAGVFTPGPSRQNALGLDAFLADNEYYGEVA